MSLIRKYECAGVEVEEFSELDSTNSYLKRKAQTVAGDLAAIAHMQTNGRGRLGRSFYSPESGLYMSLLWHGFNVNLAHLITPAASIAVARALEACGSEKAGIKWVNDIYISGKKVCGILTETGSAQNQLNYAIIGIGINLAEPDGGFPKDIKDRAGAVFASPAPGLRNRLANETLRNLSSILDSLETRSFLDEYRERSVVLGKNIFILDGAELTEARAIAIDNDCKLIVETSNGIRGLFTEEVSIRL